MSAALFGKQILVVEARPIVSLDLVLSLEQIGANVAVAPTPESALELLKIRDVEAAVVDLGISGSANLCAHLRKRSIPCVLHNGGELVDVTSIKLTSKPSMASIVTSAVASTLRRFSASEHAAMHPTAKRKELLRVENPK